MRFALYVSVVSMNRTQLPPDIHIYTSSKQPWVILPASMPAVPEYYNAASYWSKESLERRAVLRGSRSQ